MNRHNCINYIELPAADFQSTRRFYEAAFDWQFTPYGDDYLAFKDPVLEGGFFKSDLSSQQANGAALVIFYSENLDETQRRIEQAGGIISRPVYSFPGGRRFHFNDPAGNEFAVWSDR